MSTHEEVPMEIESDAPASPAVDVVRSLSYHQLRSLKNAMIGNPSAKEGRTWANRHTICAVVQTLYSPLEEGLLEQTKSQTEAAHVVASLSYGDLITVETLLEMGTTDAILQALVDVNAGRTRPDQETRRLDSTAIAALARALKCMVAAALLISGLGNLPFLPLTKKLESKPIARMILGHVFELESLDILLPFLVDPDRQLREQILELLATALVNEHQQSALAAWIPRQERVAETKAKRGWEYKGGGVMQGSWIMNNLVRMIVQSSLKTRESALDALAALVRGQPRLAYSLCQVLAEFEDQRAPLSVIAELCIAREQPIRSAAWRCFINIVRAGRSESTNPLYTKWFRDPPYTLLGVLNSTIANADEIYRVRSDACFSLYELVVDDLDLQIAAFTSGSLTSLMSLLLGVVQTTRNWEETDEPRDQSILIESSLTALAAVLLQADEIRALLIQEHGELIAIVSHTLSHPEPGVRLAACQSIRVLSRSVSVLRTAIGDSNLATNLLKVIDTDTDDRVKVIALKCVINMINDFSPTRETLFHSGVVPKLADLIEHGDEEIQIHAVWAIRNALHHGDAATVNQTMQIIGWSPFVGLLLHHNSRIRELACGTLANITASAPCMEIVYRAIPNLRAVLEDLVDPEQAENIHVHVLGALANFSAYEAAQVLSSPKLLGAIRNALLHDSLVIRHTALYSVHHLIAGRSIHVEICNAEIDAALRGLVQMRLMPSAPVDNEYESKEMRQLVKEALRTIEAGIK